MTIGICVGETSLSELTFISNDMPRVGEYVLIDYDGRSVLGMIESMVRGNDALNADVHDVNDIKKMTQMIGDDYYRGVAVVLLHDRRQGPVRLHGRQSGIDLIAELRVPLLEANGIALLGKGLLHDGEVLHALQKENTINLS